MSDAQYRYYRLGDVCYWADENTKVTQGSVEINRQEFVDWYEATYPPAQLDTQNVT